MAIPVYLEQPLVAVTLDPDGVTSDSDRDNNRWQGSVETSTLTPGRPPMDKACAMGAAGIWISLDGTVIEHPDQE